MSNKELVFTQSPERVPLPDSGDRTRNDPCYLMSSNDLLKLAKFMNVGVFTPGGIIPKRELNEDNLKPIIEQALSEGWDEVKLIGKQLLFSMYFKDVLRDPIREGWVNRQ